MTDACVLEYSTLIRHIDPAPLQWLGLWMRDRPSDSMFAALDASASSTFVRDFISNRLRVEDK